MVSVSNAAELRYSDRADMMPSNDVGTYPAYSIYNCVHTKIYQGWLYPARHSTSVSHPGVLEWDIPVLPKLWWHLVQCSKNSLKRTIMERGGIPGNATPLTGVVATEWRCRDPTIFRNNDYSGFNVVDECYPDVEVKSKKFPRDC